MFQVCPRVFGFSGPTQSDRNYWPLRLENLQKLMKGLNEFYEMELQVDSSRVVDFVDLTAIAKNRDKGHLVRLLELVMGAVVQCQDKETYISRIISLNETVQAELMVFIQKIMDRLENPRSQEESNSFKEQKDNLLVQLEEVQNSLKDSARKEQQLELENENLQQKVKDLEAEMERLSKRQGSKDMSLVSMELEAKLSHKETLIKDLQSQITDLKKNYGNELTQLKDELDVANERNIQLQKAETQLELYKKRLEDLNSYKRKVKELEEAKKELQERLEDKETDTSGTLGLKQSLNFYKEQLTAEKDKAASMSIQLEDREKVIKEYQKSKKEWDQRRSVLEINIKELQDELERVRNNPDTARESDDSFSIHRGFMTELEEQNQKLLNENQVLKAQLGNESILSDLNQQIDSAFKERKLAEEKLAKEQQEKKKTEHSLKELQQEYTEYQESTHSKLTELQKDLEEVHREKENLALKAKELEETKAMLETLNEELGRMKQDRDAHIAEMKKLFREKDEVTQKFMEAKEEIHQLQTQIAQKEGFLKASELDREKLENKLQEAQESERIALNELEVHKNKTPVHSQGEDKIKYLELERDVNKLNSEVSLLKLSLKEKDEAIHSLKQEKEKTEAELNQSLLNAKENLSASHQEEIRRLENELSEKENEINYLQSSKEEMQSAWNKEMKLMSMVLHEVGLEVMRVNRTMKEDKSFMNLKRNRAA